MITKGSYLTLSQATTIISTAMKILRERGIKIPDKSLLNQLEKMGFSTSLNSVLIPEKKFYDFIEIIKKNHTTIRPYKDHLDGEISIYATNYLDPISGEEIPYTKKNLVEMTQFVNKATNVYAFTPTVPGYPLDVAPELSSLYRYKAAVENCHDSMGWPLEPDTVISAKYMFEMAEVCDKPMDRLPVYMISPLTLGGDSLDIVLKYQKQLKSAYVFAMPTLGVTTPMSLSMGFALGLAEVIGGAILVSELTGLPVDIKPNLFPFDFKSFSLGFGTPEKFLFEMMSADLMAWVTDSDIFYKSANLHTVLKRPFPLTAANRGAMMAMAALNGATKFYGIGTLDTDAIFSPVQLCNDLEVMAFIGKTQKGLPKDSAYPDFFDELDDGLKDGFIQSDRSLEDYGDYFAPTPVMEKQILQPISKDKDVADETLRMYNKISAMEVTYEIDKNISRELDKIYTAAQNSL